VVVFPPPVRILKIFIYRVLLLLLDMEESVEEAVAGLFTRLEGQVKKHQSKRAIKTCDESASYA
jgi:hypothetical protein